MMRAPAPETHDLCPGAMAGGAGDAGMREGSASPALQVVLTGRTSQCFVLRGLQLIDSAFAMDELEKHVQEVQLKFDHAFVAVSFSALALSFQYSPKMGIHWPWVLVSSWIMFILAAAAGGWRLVQINMHGQLLIRLKGETIKVDDRAKILREYVPGMPAVINSHTGEQVSFEKLAFIQEKGLQSIRQIEAQLKDIRAGLPGLFKLQMYAFLAALVLNGTFVSKNFLNSAIHVCEQAAR